MIVLMKPNMKEMEAFNLVERVQREFNTTFTIQEIVNITWLAKRKCEINKKGEDYIPLMLENELRNLAMRNIINGSGGADKCVRYA